jgi:hypothetical protein
MNEIYIDSLKIIDWETRIFIKAPYIQKDNCVEWLISHNYQIISYVEFGNADIHIYQVKNIKNISLYAVLFPDIAEFRTECLFMNIPTKKDAYLLIDNVMEQLRLLIEQN